MGFTDEDRAKALRTRQEKARLRIKAIKNTKARSPTLSLRALGEKFGVSAPTVMRALNTSGNPHLI